MDISDACSIGVWTVVEVGLILFELRFEEFDGLNGVFPDIQPIRKRETGLSAENYADIASN